ncbi:DNA polymerase III subunit delta [Helicobacter turcicus]|uniref:DNA polymerase III subunit delta n=1 Tax=Helicobacter turcicus TaxID=2867412 RepID=A0ABS7JQ10_9HELI|nr:DNA polymerase III subunit delta [Helicobacter turcicus]MBX7491460.1 DNA polymerase III subunit delta [Helicobacter turcicus]MBX7545919.1 DNA polymerase III subunit delta [Helicobacter turcicus]
MYKKELDTKLAKNIPIRAIFLYGADAFLIGYYGEKIAKIALDRGCEKNSFHFNAFDFQNALNCFLQGSLFGNEALVWIKVDKKIPKKQLDSLVEALLKNGNGTLILEFYQAENKTSVEYMADARTMVGSFGASLAKHGVFEVRFFVPNLYEAMPILQEYARELQIKIPDFLLHKIFEQQNLDLGLSIAELRKYGIFEQEITAEMIESLGYGLGSVEVDEILELLLLKKPYFMKLSQFIEQGFDENQLVRAVQKYFFTLFLLTSHIRLKGDSNLSEALGYNPPKAILDRKKAFATTIKETQYESIFFVLNTWREELFKGINRGNGFLSALIKIQAILR